MNSPQRRASGPNLDSADNTIFLNGSSNLLRRIGASPCGVS